MKTTLRLAVMILLVTSIATLGRSVYVQLSKFKEINQAEGQVQKLSKENSQLQDRLKAEDQPSSVEKEARDKLGYQQPGDTLYVIDTSENGEGAGAEKAKPNWQAWFDILFR